MFNVLRMDMYQVFRGSLFRVSAVLVLLFSFASAAALWFMTTPMYTNFANGVGQTEALSQMTQIEAFGNSLMGGTMLALLITLFVAIILTNEFNSGFIKNVLTSRTSRASYFASKVISIVVAALVLLLIGVVSALIFFAVFGLPLTPSPLGDIALWIVCMIVLIVAMSMLVALVAWFTRSKVASVLVAVFITTGLAVSLLGAILSFFPDAGWLTNYTLYMTLDSIGYGIQSAGAFSLAHILGVALGFFALYSVLSYIVVRKKDV